MKRKVLYKKIPFARVRQIVAFCDDLGLIPANLVTPRLVELVYNEWREHHKSQVIAEEQLELSRLYLHTTTRRLNRRLRRVCEDWKGGLEGNRVSGFPPGMECFYNQILLDFDTPELPEESPLGRRGETRREGGE